MCSHCIYYTYINVYMYICVCVPSSNIQEKNGNSLQYSCLGNPMDRGIWQATVRGVTKNWTLLSG